MAKEIIRDGIKYSVAHTFKFDKDGNISESYDGGEIYESDVDAIIRDEKLTAELDAKEKELDEQLKEWNTPLKKNNKSKTKGII